MLLCFRSKLMKRLCYDSGWFSSVFPQKINWNVFWGNHIPNLLIPISVDILMFDFNVGLVDQRTPYFILSKIALNWRQIVIGTDSWKDKVGCMIHVQLCWTLKLRFKSHWWFKIIRLKFYCTSITHTIFYWASAKDMSQHLSWITCSLFPALVKKKKKMEKN